MSDHDIHNEACGCVVMPAPVTVAPVGGGEGAGEPDEHDPMAMGERLTVAHAEALNAIAALRARVAELEAKAQQVRQTGAWLDGFLRGEERQKARADALAVEVERLKRERDDANTRRATDMEKRAVTAEIANERLRAAIEAAPHTPECPVCDCWKKAALEGSAR